MARLFIYGTLGPGGPNEHIMTAIGGTWHTATTQGHLRAEGWGAEMGYPGLVPDPGGPEIKGHVFISDQLEQNWAALDAFEGEGYQRTEIMVKTGDGQISPAFAYILKPAEDL